MEADVGSQEVLLENRSQRAKHTRMMEQLLFYHGEVTKLPWTDDNTRLFHQVFLRYVEAPPLVDVRDGALGAKVTERLRRNNSQLWVVNQSLSRDLRMLETKFEDLMVQKRSDAGTMTAKDEQQENLKTLEADVDALKVEIDTLKDEKMKTEEKERCVREDVRVLQTLMQALQKEANEMDAEITDVLKTDVEKLSFKEQKQALREQAGKLQSRKSQLEESLQRLEASTRPSLCLSVMWRRFFPSR